MTGSSGGWIESVIGRYEDPANILNRLQCNTIQEQLNNGPKMGPKLRKTSVKYVNKCPETIENAKAYLRKLTKKATPTNLDFAIALAKKYNIALYRGKVKCRL